ncbi:YggS family pyridoxal phosphate-dependent enzyme [Oceanirhabdus sp. W0125-5]|uniref:YggS family pyridoxal phosphate-dependent enzyme n=1 Tax=Oceanirhabdus sp. W0125-5 TaxID=2999116 RepID=UPI0022F2B77E|nr:YggS family pyridoxal phosphate-dependent enzyme [Oceanirhabdus sp. W0125-5]WBW95350.1 YggS family pyridoxal phosphate-dependent enzyme [Oceanirhabdus sp. W0125-5]
MSLSVIDNVKKIRKEIPETVSLICVSKTKPNELIMEAYEAGEREFGENKAQDLRDKYEELPKDIKWHFIGHLQRNKIKYIVGKIHLLHSLDGVKLLQELEKRYEKEGLELNALIQINVGEEESKTGIHKNEVNDFIQEVEKCSHIKVKGIMAIIPKGDEEQCRNYFREMKEMFDDLKKVNYKNISMEILSMGMSGDYKIAIEEGSNMIRVGTGVFGNREYK